MPRSFENVKNLLLRQLSHSEFDIVKKHLTLVETHLHEVFLPEDTPIDTFVFPETGFVSITTSGTRKVEIGLVGREGVLGASAVLLGSTQSPYRHFTQSAGEALVLDLSAWPAIDAAIPSFRLTLLRFVHTLSVQTAQTAFVNACHHIETRLARWLLMCQDRLASDQLQVTHEFLSMMLGVQRTSVTLALQTLETHRLIHARRGRVEIRDRESLVAFTHGGYGLPEAEYERLFPFALRPVSPDALVATD